MSASLRVSTALVLGILLFAPDGGTQTVPAPVYFYITSDPAIFQRAFSPIFRARMKRYDEERITPQYCKFLQRTLLKDWYKYAHHAFVHGPFASEADASADYHRKAGGGSPVIYPRELAGFTYHDASILLGVVNAPTAQAGPPGPPPWDSALSDLPIAVYRPGEYSWTSTGEGTSSTTMTVEELRPSAAVIFVDPAANLKTGSDEAQSLRAEAMNALNRGIDVVLASPARSPASVAAAVSTLKAQFTAKGRRLELAVGEAAAMKQVLTERLTELLSLSMVPLKVNELMASNKGAVKGEAGDFPDWVELLNTGSAPVDLEGMYVSDKHGARSLRRISGSDRTRTMIPPNGRIVLWLDGNTTLGPTHIALRLSAQGDRFTLLDIDGVTVIDQIEFGPQPPDKTYARIPDGSGRWQTNREPTLGGVNK